MLIKNNLELSNRSNCHESIIDTQCKFKKNLRFYVQKTSRTYVARSSHASIFALLNRNVNDRANLVNKALIFDCKAMIVATKIAKKSLESKRNQSIAISRHYLRLNDVDSIDILVIIRTMRLMMLLFFYLIIVAMSNF